MTSNDPSPIKSVTEAADAWSADYEPPIEKPPFPYAASSRPLEPLQSGDLTISSIADHDAVPPLPERKNCSTAVTTINIRDNLRPPVSLKQTLNAPACHGKPPMTALRGGDSSISSAIHKTKFGSVSASPQGGVASGSSNITGRTPTVRRIGSSAGHFTPSAVTGKTSKTPGVGRSGSVAGTTLSRPHPPASKFATTIKKPPQSNASFAMNESVMSFMPTGEVDADGNPLSKTEEERMRIEVEVAYCRAMQYQIMRAKLKRAAEAQSRDVVAQLGALWEETQRLRESAAEKRAEAADIRRQRELHLATKLGGASLLPDDEANFTKDSSKHNTNTPVVGTGGHPPTVKRIRSKGSAKKETNENSSDLRTVCELLAPTMKDLSLLAGSIDKRRHALPMKDVVNASSKHLTGALHYFEGALIDMPKMAKMAAMAPDGETTQTAETISTFRESAQVLGRECLQTADALQISGEMICHVLALEECSRLKAKSSDFTGKL